MFREMRRSKQALSQQECVAILNNCTSGVLAVSGDDDYPYAIPISYVYDGTKLYFHSAKSGHKLDAIKRNSKVSFCVIDQDQVVPEEYTSYFRSVILFGKMRILEDEQEKRSAIEMLAIKYAPNDTQTTRQKVIDKDYKPLCMMELVIDHMTGKEAIDLTKARQ